MLAEQDNLIKSIFYDMFGDPAINDKKWNSQIMKNLGNFKNGVNFSKASGKIKMRCLGVSDFKNLATIKNPEKCSEILLETHPNDEYMLKDDDIIFVRSNGNKDLVGRCVSVKTKGLPIVYSGFCIRFRRNTHLLNTKFLLYFLKYETIKKQYRGRGANIQNLNQQILSAINILLPPIELQQKFATIVEGIEAQKEKIKSSIAETQTLFASLMAKYFDEE